MRLLMLRAGILFMMLWTMAGCVSLSSSPFAEKWESQVTPHVLFSQVLQDPQAFMGTTLKVGGEVISAKRYPDRTEVMVLQLPLEADSVPGMVRAQSLGRLIAVQKTFLDPATLPPGTRLTLIGTVTGNQTVQVDEQSKTYPVLAIKVLHVWPAVPPGYYPYGPSYRRAYPFWGPGAYWNSSWSFPRSSYWAGRRPFGLRRSRR